MTATKFSDLSQKELYRSAIEDFAVDVKKTDSKTVIEAALLESGVVWADYVAQHPEIAPPVEDGVVTTSNMKDEEEEEVNERVPAPKVRTKEDIPVDSADQYLIKMDRENPLFQVRGYTFTQENPYALMNADDAQHVLTKEDGFRQATPEELSEYYG